MNAVRATVVAALLALAVVLQLSFFPHLAWRGIGPDLALMVVVATALTRGAESGMIVGFAAGVLLDLAPPADHLVGRWALALSVVGYVAGRVRAEMEHGSRPPVLTTVATVAACSFLGTSLFALSGMALGEQTGSTGEVLQTVLGAMVWDVALTPLLVPPLMALVARLEPGRA